VNLLLDTDVPSEVRRPAPDPEVIGWIDTIDKDRCFISIASIAVATR
jgi:predicted nucleic acid-binding protein